MTDLVFRVVGAEPERFAASPTLLLKLAIEERSGTEVHMMSLHTQIRIEPQQRGYSVEEQGLLLDLFGETPQWGDSLRPFSWAHVDTVVNGFRDRTEVDLRVPCTYDFEVAGAKFLHSLRGGDVPLLLLFSGTVFTRGERGVDAGLVSWSTEAPFSMPVQLWRDTMDLYFPSSTWLRLSRDIFDDLQRFKASRALPTWEQAIEALLKEADGAQ